MSDVYVDADSWLCRPDVDDACEVDLDATVVDADGTTTVERFERATDSTIDCFYVYPTVSNDRDARSDMDAGAEEENVVRQQAARLGAACDLYAPIYRQATRSELRRTLTGTGNFFGAMDDAYDDVLDAWRHYLENDNDSRGVIVIGHSQGASHLARLLKDEIDPDPGQRSLLVSGMLLGTSAHTGDYRNLHVCGAPDDTGCIISYSSFRATAPPPANSFFARPEAGEEAICTNPASLAGGSGELHPYFSDGAWGVEVSTPFVTLPGLVSAECVSTNGFRYLALSVHADEATPRVDDIRGDLGPQWGMHLIDVNVAMGDLVEVARSQAAAYRSG